jgi:uncharacterized protein (TIGR04255 family)
LSSESLPVRIHPDAIVEALVEVQFETTELPEIVVSRLVDAPRWSEFTHARLPAADIPPTVREINPSLKYQPSIEMTRKDRRRAYKVGERVISFHVVQEYPGWEIFRSEIQDVLRESLGKLKSFRATRVGLRYINLLSRQNHFVNDITDTAITLSVANDRITSGINASYLINNAQQVVLVRIATADVIQIPAPLFQDFSVLCDIDVSTPPSLSMESLDSVLDWIEVAHNVEKSEFFRLLPPRIIDALRPEA